MVEGDNIPRMKNLHHTSAALECLPPVAERKTRNLQNFFPSLHLLEEEVLEQVEKEPFPDEVLLDWESERLADCPWQADWENCSSFAGFHCLLSIMKAF